MFALVPEFLNAPAGLRERKKTFSVYILFYNMHNSLHEASCLEFIRALNKCHDLFNLIMNVTHLNIVDFCPC